MVDRLVGWCVVLLVRRRVAWLVVWLVGGLFCWLVGGFIGWSVVGWLVGFMYINLVNSMSKSVFFASNYTDYVI